MRVIAGSFGGRRLQAPRGDRTRPTSDRVRESLFMALGDLSDLNVVDLYAGSGALGIEALSRGARRADFVEPDARARGALERNLASLGIRSGARIWPLRLPQGLKHLAEPLEAADVVLMDPPYGGGPAREALLALGAPGRLKRGARVVVEHHAKDRLPETSGALERVRERRIGETVVTTYRTAAQAGPGEEGDT